MGDVGLSRAAVESGDWMARVQNIFGAELSYCSRRGVG